MANIPQKSKDATEEALTAIQEALNIRAPETPTGTSFEPAANSDAATAAPTPPASDLFPQEAPPAGWPIGDTVPRRAANDDRAGIGQILQALRHRSGRAPFIAAGIGSFIWAAGVIATATLYGAEVRSVFATPGVGLAAVVALVAAIAVPVIFFFVLAHMFNRAQDMRVVAESMAEVAMRLAQPETVAHESIVTVGQAIRREVAAMGDGVERALARAAELEALVANEVSALERAYNDNEVRIRGLLETLAHQRDTLVGQAEQVRNAITGVHLDLSHDISSVSENVANKINDSADRIAQALTEKGEHITLALGHAGDSMIGALGERGGDLLERLERASQETSHAIAGASDRLTASLNFKTDHITEEFAEMTTNLAQMMDGRLDEVTQGFAQKSLAIVQLMDDRSAQITEGLVDSSSRLAETIATTGDEVNSTLKSTGDSLILDLSLRGGDVVSKLEQ